MLFYECFVYVSKAFYEVRLGFVGRMEDLERGAIKKVLLYTWLSCAQPLWVLQAGFAGFTVYFKVQIWGLLCCRGLACYLRSLGGGFRVVVIATGSFRRYTILTNTDCIPKPQSKDSGPHIKPPEHLYNTSTVTLKESCKGAIEAVCKGNLN